VIYLTFLIVDEMVRFPTMGWLAALQPVGAAEARGAAMAAARARRAAANFMVVGAEKVVDETR
jgi:hypothetical protein